MERLNVKKFLEMNNNGKRKGELCPQCGSEIFVGSNGNEWCEGETCDWSNNSELSHFIKSSLNRKK
jgi:hypothetical protein